MSQYTKKRRSGGNDVKYDNYVNKRDMELHEMGFGTDPGRV